jgi:hypothetical protein
MSLIRRRAAVVRVHPRSVGRQLVSGAAAVLIVALAGVIAGSQPAYQTDDYGYDPKYFNAEQREGRDTWYFWTGGSERFWVDMARVTDGAAASWARSRSPAAKRRPAPTSTASGSIAAISPSLVLIPHGYPTSSAALCCSISSRTRRSTAACSATTRRPTSCSIAATYSAPGSAMPTSGR